MRIFDLRRNNHPRYSHNYLDSCVFRKDDNDKNITRILALIESRTVDFVLPQTVKDEVNHNHTPREAKDKAKEVLLSTFPVQPSAKEKKTKERVHTILIDNAINEKKHKSDADHVLEAGIHHGYFITTDHRILKKREQLKAACGVRIVTPGEWLELYDRPIPKALSE